MFEYKIKILKNGLGLVTVPLLQVESVTVMVGVGAGSRYERRRINGLSHFLEHMAFKGTKKRPTTKQIASEAEGVGGVFNAFTDKEFTGYWLKLPAKHQRLAFDILADILSNSLFRPEEIEREKGVIIEEINMREDVPMTKAVVEFERLLYGDNPLGWDIAGEKEIVAKISRRDFLAYLSRLYYPENIVVAVAGKIKNKEVTELTAKYFSSLRKTGKKVTKPIKIIQSEPRLKLITKKTEQAHFCLGVPGYDLFHQDRYVLKVLAAILGGGMSSRLFLEIRERRGLAYYVGTELDYRTDCGFLLNRAGVRLPKIEEAIKVTLDQMGQLATRKVSQSELTKAQEMFKGHLALFLEDSRNLAEQMAAQWLLEKKIRDYKEIVELIERVTTEDILRVAKELFRPEKLNLAVVGPYKEENRFKNLLK